MNFIVKHNLKRFIGAECLLFLALCLAACASSGAPENEQADRLTGIYTGVIPAADCPGISVVAILNAQTGKYKITYQYIDRDLDLYTYTGTFTWNRESGIVTLDSGDLPRYYKAGKQTLTQLDMNGKAISGILARNYELRKVETYYE